jgi:hypothetical protein
MCRSTTTPTASSEIDERFIDLTNRPTMTNTSCYRFCGLASAKTYDDGGGSYLRYQHLSLIT